MIESELPQELYLMTSWENTDFVIKVKRAYPKVESISQIMLLIICVYILAAIFVFILEGLFVNKTVYIWIIVFISTVFFIFWTYKILNKWGYYVWTTNRLLSMFGKTTKSVYWKNFTDEIMVEWNDITWWDVFLQLRPKEGIPAWEDFSIQYVSFIDIKNPIEISEICRKRIKENNQKL